jgi:transcriptional regulator with XRE-family HTH domain
MPPEPPTTILDGAADYVVTHARKVLTPKPHLARFAARMKQAMNDQGMTQAAVAKAMWGVIRDPRGYEVPRNRDRISLYLRGMSQPEPRNLERLAEVLKVPLDELRPGAPPVSDDDRATPRRQANRTQLIEVKPGVVLLKVSVLVPMGQALKVMTILEQHGIRDGDTTDEQ